jgi:hypothetical protein
VFTIPWNAVHVAVESVFTIPWNPCSRSRGIRTRFASKACLSRLIPYQDVSEWKRFALRPGGSISRNLRIITFMQRYGVSSYSITESRRDVYSEEEVRALARRTSPRSPIAKLSRLLPAAAPYLLAAQSTV